MSPCCAVPLTAGGDILPGALPLLAVVTTTSCSTVAARPAASVTVRFTYLVPALLNVNVMV
jgi:hypothetical protein